MRRRSPWDHLLPQALFTQSKRKNAFLAIVPLGIHYDRIHSSSLKAIFGINLPSPFSKTDSRNLFPKFK